MQNWHIVTGEYPPQPGGVSDYTRLVARELAKAGDVVHVYCPPCDEAAPHDVGVEVHRLPGHFGLRALRELSVVLKVSSRCRRVLVQYVPQAFGCRGMNILFCFWLWLNRNRSIWVMFHEVYFPVRRKQSLLQNTFGSITRVMAWLTARAASRIFVSIPAWEDLVKPMSAANTPISWLPIPSLIPVHTDASSRSAIRSQFAPGGAGLIIGHFGTYGRYVAEMLFSLLPRLLSGKADRALLLLGRGGESMRDEFLCRYPDLSGRVHATGATSAADVSSHLQACDVLLQPFVDGVSSRRTSLMAGLANGRPIVTTQGALTESLWAESGAVVLVNADDVDGTIQMVERLLVDAVARKSLSRQAAILYQQRFDIRHTLSGLTETDA